MADQLPIIGGTRAINATGTASTSLIGRGLSAILNKETSLALSEQDARYRQARDIYNRITDYGWETRFNAGLLPKRGEQLDLFEANPLQPFYDMIRQLADVFIVFQQLADKGYGKAYLPLANMYRGGQGINKNIEKADYYSQVAFDWCFANQSLNDPEIWRDLGAIYSYGNGIEQDNEYYNEQSKVWYRKASDHGDTGAQCNLGWSYLYKEDEQAYVLFLKAAEQGYRRAQYHLAEMYECGNGIEEDGKKAVFWYLKAAKQGDVNAQVHLGWLYLSNEGLVAQDNDQALFWCRRAAVQGLARAQNLLGFMYVKAKNITEALFWYQISAEQGNASAQNKLGGMYLRGSLNTKIDVEKSVFWYLKAIEQDHSTAILHLAINVYGRGRHGKKEDDVKVVTCYQRLAEQGDAVAQFGLGIMYENGSGIDPDGEQALFWIQKSAEQGLKRAQENLTNRGINWKNT